MKNYKEVLDFNDVYEYLNHIRNDDSLSEEEYIIVKLIFQTITNMPRRTVSLDSHWDFVVNEKRVGYYEGKITTLYYSGYKCSNCGHGGGEAIPESFGEMTEQEAKVIFEGMNYRFCPNCGARMVNGNNESK